MHRNWTVTGEQYAREDRARAQSDSLQTSSHFLAMLEKNDENTRSRAYSTPDLLTEVSEGTETVRQRPELSILDRIMLEKDRDEAGLTHSVIAEISILLWMIMDAGNAWTAMAMNLLALDESACEAIQREIDELVGIHGRKNLFKPEVLDKMGSVDALIWDAIRLTPQFLGGMKVVQGTSLNLKTHGRVMNVSCALPNRI